MGAWVQILAVTSSRCEYKLLSLILAPTTATSLMLIRLVKYYSHVLE